MAEPPPVKKVTRVYLVAHGFAIHVPFSHCETKTTALQGHALQEAAQFKGGDKATLRIREDRTGEPRSIMAMRGEAVEQGVTALWSEAERTAVVSGDR